MACIMLMAKPIKTHVRVCSLHQSKIKFFQQFCGTKTNINNLCFNIIIIHVGELRCHPYGYNSFPDQNALNPLVPMVTNINFLLTISIDCPEIRLCELLNWSPKRKCLDLLSNSLNPSMKEMYRDQFGEFVCGYWGLKG